MDAVKRNATKGFAARRAALGWSMRKLARKAGVRHETVASLERGTYVRGPHRSTIDHIDRVLARAETGDDDEA